MSKTLNVTLGDDFVTPESDIVLKIDFAEGKGSAARVFEIAADLIRSFEDLDRTLITTIDSSIATQLIVEDLQKSSLKIFLRNVLRETDDQALKDLDWKPQVGKYLVKAKYAVLEYLDKDISDEEPPKITDLTNEIRILAASTDVRHIPDYPAPNPTRLIQSLDGIQRIKAQFDSEEALTITLDKSEYAVNLESDWLPSDKIKETVDAEHELSNEIDMVLVIKQPEFLTDAKWQFKHGKKPFSAGIEDSDWLRKFKLGDVSIKPGDALQVRVRFDYKYDPKGNLIESYQVITKVVKVVKSAISMDDMFDDQS